MKCAFVVKCALVVAAAVVVVGGGLLADAACRAAHAPSALAIGCDALQ